MGCTYRYVKKGRTLPVWWVKYYRDGRAFCESSHSKKEADAVRLLRDREGAIAKGVAVTSAMGRLKFEEAAHDMINDYQVNGRRSCDEAERRIRLHLLPFFGGRRLAGVTAADVRSYIVKRQADSIITAKARRTRTREGWIETPEARRPVSNGEINRELTTLKRIFSLAVDGEKLLHRPKIPMLREAPARSGFFERAQFEAVLARLPDALKAPIRFAYITGWRVPSEVLALTWPQIDFDSQQVVLLAGTSKTGEPRTFPFTAELRTLLEQQDAERRRLAREGRISPYVFSRDGAPIKSLLRAFKAAGRAAGLPGRIPHDLRRTAIRNLVRAGVSESVAMKLSGHKTRSIFDRYNITSAQDLRDAAGRLDVFAAKRTAVGA